MTQTPASVLFVCLGNICRSPMAEGAFRAVAGRSHVKIDSAGTGSWHVGRPPDPRAQAAARAVGVDISGLRARQVQAEDFDRFDLILALDNSNLRDLHRLRGGRGRLALLLDYVPGREGGDVADPYYGGPDDFALAWTEIAGACANLFREEFQSS